MSNDAGEKPIEKEEENFHFVEPGEVNNESVDEKETVDESVEEEVESQEETPQEEKPNKENPDRFEFWQSKFTKEQQEREKLAEKLEQYESKFGEVDKTVAELKGRIPEPKEELPPQEPQGDFEDNPIEWIKYHNEVNKNLRKDYSDFKNSVQQERQAREAEERQRQEKSFYIGKYVEAGMSLEEAQKMHDAFTKPESFSIENQVAFYKFLNGQQAPAPKKKNLNSPAPPGITPSVVEDKKEPSFMDDLVGYQKKTGY